MSAASNAKLWPKYQQQLSKLGETYVKSCGYLTTWLSDSRAYYDDARPQIVTLLEVAHHTLNPSPSTPFSYATCPPALREFGEAYRKIIHKAYQFRGRFAESDLRARLEKLYPSTLTEKEREGHDSKVKIISGPAAGPSVSTVVVPTPDTSSTERVGPPPKSMRLQVARRDSSIESNQPGHQKSTSSASQSPTIHADTPGFVAEISAGGCAEALTLDGHSRSPSVELVDNSQFASISSDQTGNMTALSNPPSEAVTTPFRPAMIRKVKLKLGVPPSETPLPTSSSQATHATSSIAAENRDRAPAQRTGSAAPAFARTGETMHPPDNQLQKIPQLVAPAAAALPTSAPSASLPPATSPAPPRTPPGISSSRPTTPAPRNSPPMVCLAAPEGSPSGQPITSEAPPDRLHSDGQMGHSGAAPLSFLKHMIVPTEPVSVHGGVGKAGPVVQAAGKGILLVEDQDRPSPGVGGDIVMKEGADSPQITAPNASETRPRSTLARSANDATATSSTSEIPTPAELSTTISNGEQPSRTPSASSASTQAKDKPADFTCTMETTYNVNPLPGEDRISPRPGGIARKHTEAVNNHASVIKSSSVVAFPMPWQGGSSSFPPSTAHFTTPASGPTVHENLLPLRTSLPVDSNASGRSGNLPSSVGSPGITAPGPATFARIAPWTSHAAPSVKAPIKLPAAQFSALSVQTVPKVEAYDASLSLSNVLGTSASTSSVLSLSSTSPVMLLQTPPALGSLPIVASTFLSPIVQATSAASTTSPSQAPAAPTNAEKKAVLVRKKKKTVLSRDFMMIDLEAHNQRKRAREGVDNPATPTGPAAEAMAGSMSLSPSIPDEKHSVGVNSGTETRATSEKGSLNSPARISPPLSLRPKSPEKTSPRKEGTSVPQATPVIVSARNTISPAPSRPDAVTQAKAATADPTSAIIVRPIAEGEKQTETSRLSTPISDDQPAETATREIVDKAANDATPSHELSEHDSVLQIGTRHLVGDRTNARVSPRDLAGASDAGRSHLLLLQTYIGSLPLRTVLTPTLTPSHVATGGVAAAEVMKGPTPPDTNEHPPSPTQAIEVNETSRFRPHSWQSNGLLHNIPASNLSTIDVPPASELQKGRGGDAKSLIRKHEPIEDIPNLPPKKRRRKQILTAELVESEDEDMAGTQRISLPGTANPGVENSTTSTVKAEGKTAASISIWTRSYSMEQDMMLSSDGVLPRREADVEDYVLRSLENHFPNDTQQQLLKVGTPSGLVCFKPGLPCRNAKLRFSINVDRVVWNKCLRWINRRSEPLSGLATSLCVSLEAYKRDDLPEHLQKNTELWNDEFKLPKCSWPSQPSHALIWVKGAVAVHLELSPPWELDEGGRLDLTPYCKPALNRLEVYHAEPADNFVFVLRIHQPNVQQWATKRQELRWKGLAAHRSRKGPVLWNIWAAVDSKMSAMARRDVV